MMIPHAAATDDHDDNDDLDDVVVDDYDDDDDDDCNSFSDYVRSHFLLQTLWISLSHPSNSLKQGGRIYSALIQNSPS